MDEQSWWTWTQKEALQFLESTTTGLKSTDIALRQKRYGQNRVDIQREHPPWRQFLSQLLGPMSLMLLFAAIVSGISREWVDMGIILSIVWGSALISFFQEQRASTAMAALRARLSLKAKVRREGTILSCLAVDLVPGDIVELSVGSLIPADGILLTAQDLHINEAALTGETFPAFKQVGPVAASASLSERLGCVFMGTDVRSGVGSMVVVKTGAKTLLGAIAAKLMVTSDETNFERGLRQFGLLLSQTMAVLVVAVMAVNLVLHKPPVESLLFAVALAVGLAPELLPAILSLNLSRGAQQMATKGVIVRRLGAIEDFGAMRILCTDKTGTLTQGQMQLASALDLKGQASARVLMLAGLNARLQSGLSNPLDEAIVAAAPEQAGWQKLGEIPYDFVRRRLSVIVAGERGIQLISKGALEQIIEVCTTQRGIEGAEILGPEQKAAIALQLTTWSEQGLRVLGLASRELQSQTERYTVEDEENLCFEGFLLFMDPPKAGAAEAIIDLKKLGITLKVITGDHPLVAKHLVEQIGLEVTGVVTGAELNRCSDAALGVLVEKSNIFAQVDPTQKERIVRCFRQRGAVVGYMGDGINDAPALRAADVGISVDSAVDVAREAADFVLLSPDLGVLRAGIIEGRTVFANTHKYILTTTSANLGNMLSMAATSLFLPFLPLLARQILLNNFLSDLPAFGLARDNVDQELIEQPEEWDLVEIRRFMIVFGLVSAVFDGITFATLYWGFGTTPILFRSAWFVESLLTELVVALVVRTRRPFWQSRPGQALLVSTVVMALIATVFPYMPVIGPLFDLTPIPLHLLGALFGITGLYVGAVEVCKHFYFATGRSRKARHA